VTQLVGLPRVSYALTTVHIASVVMVVIVITDRAGNDATHPEHGRDQFRADHANLVGRLNVHKQSRMRHGWTPAAVLQNDTLTTCSIVFPD